LIEDLRLHPTEDLEGHLVGPTVGGGERLRGGDEVPNPRGGGADMVDETDPVKAATASLCDVLLDGVTSVGEGGMDVGVGEEVRRG